MSHSNADHLKYTEDELKKNLVLLEAHGKNYPCPECTEKHLLSIEGLAEEGTTMTDDDKKKDFFLDLAETSRTARRKLQDMAS
jgi:hypothetical protein